MRIWRTILDIVFPTSCAFCNGSVQGSEIPYFCASCWADFTLITGPVCPRCGRPFDSPDALRCSPEHECRDCRLTPPHFDQALSVGYFEGALREAIHQFKYRPCRSLGKPLGAWMAGNVRLLTGIDLIIPVPLHTSRLRHRGFNQALLLSQWLCEKHRVPVSFDDLLRVKPTRPQVELSGAERIANVENAFILRNKGYMTGKKVLLVDDVFTTGATLNECASVLKKDGAAQVVACTLARAV